MDSDRDGVGDNSDPTPYGPPSPAPECDSVNANAFLNGAAGTSGSDNADQCADTPVSELANSDGCAPSQVVRNGAVKSVILQ